MKVLLEEEPYRRSKNFGSKRPANDIPVPGPSLFLI